MPKLPDQRISVRTEDGGGEYNAKVTCGVTVDGTFTMEIPADLLDSALSLYRDHKRNPDGITPKQHGHLGPWRIQAKALAYCITFLKECAKDYLKAVEKVERVIVYRIKIEASTWIDKAGRLHPNGEHDSYEKGGKWWSPNLKGARSLDGGMGRSASTYSIGVGAEVYDRTTYSRSSGDTVVWNTVRETDDVAISKLNAFVGLDIDPDTSEHHLEVIPYTPEAANFFTMMMLGIAQMAISMEAFFGDSKKLKAAMKNPALASQLFLGNKGDK